MNHIKTDILIIGGGPAAMVAAATALEHYPQKQITLVKKDQVALVPCGIPYIFGTTLGSSEKDAMSCGGAVAEKIGIVVDEITAVDIAAKTATARAHDFVFEKLIFATGSIPFVHETLRPALALQNVFTIDKDKAAIDRVVAALEGRARVIVVGTGFIGVEIAEQLRSAHKEVTLIGGRHLLAGSFDADMAQEAEKIMQDLGVHLAMGQHASEVLSEGTLATGVRLCDGSVIEGDAIILATGYQPNTALAAQAGLKLARYGGIWVDEYMRTRNKDIFAIGDCCGRRDFITRDPSKVMLASTSAAEARVAAMSLYGLKHLKGFNGTIAIFSTMIGSRAFGCAGVTEAQAKAQGIEYVSGYFEGMNRHPTTIPGASKQSVKLIALRSSGQIIGGQVIGDREAGEIINIIGLAIEAELTAHHLVSLQVATQPLLTAAPTAYPIVKAAQKILLQR
ncbi:MAG: FAD-dependent oxidoreductase [Campylobacterales bacterium]|nr:FAD-dependent oxidoreductase [Campylobacterales bacterium]